MIETSTGTITEINDDVLKRIERIQNNADFLKSIHFDKMNPRRQRQVLRTGRAKVGRNDSCPCGSLVKFKNCCLKKENKKPLELAVPYE